MVEGSLADLRRPDAVIVDNVGAATRLARQPTGTRRQADPLKVGDTLEINDRRAVVVGICQISRTFQCQPVIYTTYTRATHFAPRERKLLSFVLVKAQPGEDLEGALRADRARARASRPTRRRIQGPDLNYFMKNTGIPINFGIAVVLGFLDRHRHRRPDLLQLHAGEPALLRHPQGHGRDQRGSLAHDRAAGPRGRRPGLRLGVGAAALFGYLMRGTELSFRLSRISSCFRGGAIAVIVHLSALYEHPQGHEAGAGHRVQNVGGVCRKTKRPFPCGASPRATVRASKVMALRGVDLEVRIGELLMLVGPSGCGKTTLISVVAAILDHDEGEIAVLRPRPQVHEPGREDRFRGANIGFVFQAYNLIPTITVTENVAIPLLILGSRRADALARAGEILGPWGSGTSWRPFPRQLSGGQQQRVAIARALVNNPQLIVWTSRRALSITTRAGW